MSGNVDDPGSCCILAALVASVYRRGLPFFINVAASSEWFTSQPVSGWMRSGRCTLGVEAADLHVPGVQVTSPPERSSWGGVYILAFDKAVWVFAPVALMESVSAAG